MLRLGLFCVVLSLVLPSFVRAQAPDVRTSASALLAGGTDGHLPFWLTAGRFGVLNYRGEQGLVRAAAQRSFGTQAGLRWSAEADVLARAGDPAALYLHQAWLGARYGAFELAAGRREQSFGRVDPVLSSGSTTLSTNAAPITKVTLATTRFLSILGTADHVAVQGYLAHGWMGTGRYVRNAWLHEKYAYLRIMPAEARVNGYLGIVHHAVWAGTHPIYGDMPDGLADLVRIALGNKDRRERGDDRPGGSSNGLAMYDVSLEAALPFADARAYRQFYFEDRPGALLRNVWDGLWGLSLRWASPEAPLYGLLYEHVYMSRQGARYADGEARGPDNYYNHGTYQDGWTYHGRTLGTPFIAADGLRHGVFSNLVAAHHVGALGHVAGIDYRLLGSYSRNGGAIVVWKIDNSGQMPGKTPRRDQYSLALFLSRAWTHGLAAELGVGLDAGDLYPRALGLSFGLRWTPPR